MSKDNELCNRSEVTNHETVDRAEETYQSKVDSEAGKSSQPEHPSLEGQLDRAFRLQMELLSLKQSILMKYHIRLNSDLTPQKLREICQVYLSL